MVITRQEIILATLASSKKSHLFTPVQVQKLFFLIDKNIGPRLGGPFFQFEPYHYGPFDKEVYDELMTLNMSDNVKILSVNNGMKMYELTAKGQMNGENILQQKINNPSIQTYLIELVDFVTKLSFTELVATIYKAYPEMKENSIFVD